MVEHEFTAGGHRIDVAYSLWNGKERVDVDGRTVSSKRFFGVVSSHRFTLEDEGQAVGYEVRLATPAGVAVIRDGAVVTSRIRRLWLYAIGIGLAYLALLAITLLIDLLNMVTGGAGLDDLAAAAADWNELTAVLAGIPLSWLVRRWLLTPSGPAIPSLHAAKPTG